MAFNFFRRNKTISYLSATIDEYILKMAKDQQKTYIFVKFSHKDKRITYHICELKGDVVEIKGCAYYLSNDNLYNFDHTSNKVNYKITTADVYEGITTGYNPLEQRLTEIYNETVQKALYLYLMTGIMENKLKSQTKMKTIIIAGLIGIGAIFVIFKMFSG